jgi:hypothetical protein
MWSIVLMNYLQVQNAVISPALVTLMTFLGNIGLNFGFIAMFGYRVSRRASPIKIVYLPAIFSCLILHNPR